MTNLKWVLVSAPDKKGKSQINIATRSGGEVSLHISGGLAADIAIGLVCEMHQDEDGVTIH